MISAALLTFGLSGSDAEWNSYHKQIISSALDVLVMLRTNKRLLSGPTRNRLDWVQEISCVPFLYVTKFSAVRFRVKRIGVLTFLLALVFTGLSFSQQADEEVAPKGVFAYALNARQLVAIGEIDDESHARLLTKAVCPTNAITSSVRLTAMRQGGQDERSGFQYDADGSVPAGNYCLLVDSKTQENLFVWGSGDAPTLVRERKCVAEVAEAAENPAGRKVASCYLIGGYGTGRVELVEYAYESADDRLVALMMIDNSLDTPRYSIARFPVGSQVWAVENAGKFRPERFRHLFTISDDPHSNLWSVAIEWDGDTGSDLTLYRPVGSELRPVIVNRDLFSSERGNSDILAK